MIIVNYDTVDFLRRSIKSVRRESIGLRAELIVVDNDSPDSSARMVEEEFPDVKLIANAVNVGFSAGTNQAIQAARGEFFLVLNADTVILPGALRTLVDFMDDHPDCGIAGPRLKYPDGRLQASCRTFYTFKTLLFRRTLLGRLFPNHPAVKEHLMQGWNHDSVRKIDWILGAAMMVRRRAVEQIGLMDERYFLYLEDVDWCFRMKQAGWAVYFCPDAEVTHVYRQASREPGLLNPDLWSHLESAVRYYDKWGELVYELKAHVSLLKLPAFLLLDALLLFMAIWGWSDWPVSIIPILLLQALAIGMGYYRFQGTEGIAELALGAARPVTAGILAGGLFFYLTQLPLPHLYRSRLAFLSAVPRAILALTSVRWLLLQLRRWLAMRRIARRRCVVVGTGPVALELAGRIGAEPGLGFEVAGFVGEDRTLSPLLGPVDSLPDLARSIRAQEVIFVQEKGSLESLMAPVVACRQANLDVKVVLTAPGAYLLSIDQIDLCDFPAMDLPGVPLDGLSRLLKRTMDVGIASATLFLLSPLLLLIGLGLKLRDGGPALIAQEHIGAGGLPYRMLKFRTTALMPDSDGLSPHDSENTPAASPFAELVRKRKLEKLPQLLNVLRGEMSLVGPRPPRPQDVGQYHDWHHSRFAEKPGVTGLWQVEKDSKWRFEQMVRLDLYYVLHRSLLLDLKVLLKSAARVLAP